MNLKIDLLLWKPNCNVADKSKGAFNTNISPISIPFNPNINIMCNNLIEAEDENHGCPVWENVVAH